MLLYISSTVSQNRNVYDFQVNAKSAVPVYEQVKRAIKQAVLSGRLPQGDRLMSIRELALLLKVNPNTIIKVYNQLEVEGFIHSRPGSGYFVKFDPEKLSRESRSQFRVITDEYLSLAVELGYSLEEVKREIKRRADLSSGSDTKGGQHAGD
jgi:GntR family transcriptional regulator